VIELFDANKTTAAPGDPITFRWVIDADAARLEIMEPSGTILQTIPVDLSAPTFTTNLPISGTSVIYRLVAVRGNDEIRAVVTVQLGTVCSMNWFFDKPVPSGGCPLAPPMQVPVTFQQFQTGYMFRIVHSGQDQVCGIQNDRNVYYCHSYQAYIDPPPATPGSGFLVPDTSFEYVFYNTLATGGFWYTVIGWGIAPASSSNVQTQVGDDSLIYIQLPIGVYAFDNNLNKQNAAVVRITQP
jgi:hypothetical protein